MGIYPAEWPDKEKPRKQAKTPYYSGVSGALKMVEAEGLEPTTH